MLVKSFKVGCAGPRRGAGAKHYYFKSLMSLHTTKPTIKLVRPAVTQIHLRTCAPILNDSFYIS